MSVAAAVDALFDPLAADFPLPLKSSTRFVFLGLALGSWIVGESLMAPVLRPFLLCQCLAYAACFFIFIAWYFRVSRLFEGPWTSYALAVSPMIWTLTPLHLLLPAALLCMHAGVLGMFVYELVKAGVILSVLTRLVHVFQQLNHWPRWQALALALSPLAMAFVVIIGMSAVGGLAIVGIALGAMLH